MGRSLRSENARTPLLQSRSVPQMPLSRRMHSLGAVCVLCEGTQAGLGDRYDTQLVGSRTGALLLWTYLAFRGRLVETRKRKYEKSTD